MFAFHHRHWKCRYVFIGYTGSSVISQNCLSWNCNKLSAFHLCTNTTMYSNTYIQPYNLSIHPTHAYVYSNTTMLPGYICISMLHGKCLLHDVNALSNDSDDFIGIYSYLVCMYTYINSIPSCRQCTWWDQKTAVVHWNCKTPWWHVYIVVKLQWTSVWGH